MSIENNLKRIADALERIAAVQVADTLTIDEAATAVAMVTEAAKNGQGTEATAAATPEPVSGAPVTPPAPPVNTGTESGVSAPATPPTTPEQTAAPVPPAPAAAPSPAPAAAMTPEQLNAALVEEYNRLGSRGPIDQVMQAEPFCVSSLHDLTPEQYQPLIDAVKKVSA